MSSWRSPETRTSAEALTAVARTKSSSGWVATPVTVMVKAAKRARRWMRSTFLSMTRSGLRSRKYGFWTARGVLKQLDPFIARDKYDMSVFVPNTVEALKIVEGVAKEGLVAMEVVEVSPPYDISDITSLMGVRLMVDTLAVMVKNGRIGGRLKV